MPAVFSISVGAMLGSGIFVLPGLAAAKAGPYVALSYLLAGVLVLPAVLSKAELATAMPVAGGTYVYVDRAMGPWLGTIAGLGTWLALSAKTGFAVVGLASYLVLFTELPAIPVALGVLTLLLIVNMLGVGKVSRLQVVIVGVCLAALTGFSLLGGLAADPANFEPAFPMGAEGILAGAGFVFVSYNGVTKVCSIAEEVKNPGRNIPLGMLSAQFTVMIIYAIVAWVITGNVPLDQLAGDITPVATAAGAIGGPAGLTIMAVIAVFALASMCNAGVLSTSRFPFAMGRDRLLPPSLERVSERFGTPVPAILLTAALLFALVLGLPVEKLAKLASGFTIFIFCVVNLALVVLRESGARWYRPTFRAPLYPWTQLVGILGGIWLLTELGAVALVAIGGAITLGTAWYFGYARHHVSRRSAVQYLISETHTLRATELAEEAEAKDRGDGEVVVPLFGGEPAPERLFRLAAAFVDDGGTLDVLRLEEIPEAVPLASFLRADEETRRLAEEALQIGDAVHVPVEFHDLLTHNAKEALNRHALATHAEWIVLERPAPRGLRFVIRHPMSWWMDHPPCDLAIFLDRGGEHDGDTSDDFRRILVLAEPGPYDSLAVHVADKLAQDQNGSITLYLRVSPDIDDGELASHTAYHRQLAQLCSSPVDSQIVRARDSGEALREISRDYDLLILGAPSERTWRSFFFDSTEHRAVDAALCSVLKVKAPRHRVHHRLGVTEENTADLPGLAGILDAAVLAPRIQARGPAELFATISRALSDVTVADSEAIAVALDKRERKQSTAHNEGVALADVTVAGLESTTLAVVTIDRAIEFHAPGRPKVDVVVVMLAPPSDRQTQLWLLEQMSQMVVRGRLLPALRVAKGADEMREAILGAARRLGGTLGGE